MSLSRLKSIVDQRWPVAGIHLRFVKDRLTGNKELDIARRYLRTGSVAVDVGARKGMYTRVMSDMVGRSGKVLAFEPNPDNAASLRKIFLNRNNVTIHECALSDHTGDAVLYIPVYSGRALDALGYVGKKPEDSEDCLQYKVQLRELDDLMANVNMSISFIKIDVEGHELAVIKGCTQIIARHRPVVFAEIEQRHSVESIQTRFELMRNYGYDTYFLDRGGQLSPLSDFDLQSMQLEPCSNNKTFVNMFLFLPKPL